MTDELANAEVVKASVLLAGLDLSRASPVSLPTMPRLPSRCRRSGLLAWVGAEHATSF